MYFVRVILILIGAYLVFIKLPLFLYHAHYVTVLFFYVIFIELPGLLAFFTK